MKALEIEGKTIFYSLQKSYLKLVTVTFNWSSYHKMGINIIEIPDFDD